MQKQIGQTLIETVIAIFILITGILSAFGLATYSLSSTQGVVRQIVAMGLAREGIEVVKNMRDTNWIRDTLPSVTLTNGQATGGCYDFINKDNGGLCYKNWLNVTGGGYTIPATTTGAPALLSFDPTSGNQFALGTPSGDYKVYFGTPSSNGALVQGTGSNASGFYRKITLQQVTTGTAFANPNMPAVLVRVDVWWTQKGCPASSDVPTSSGCKLTLETYLTNWRTY